jgi:hypothetical protein
MTAPAISETSPMRALLIAAALFAAAPAVAQTPAAPATHAVLSDAARAPAGRLIIDGATWRCEGATCSASGGTSQPATRACRRVVARLGAVSAFSYKGVTLSAEQIAACNA